ncbi:MAG: RDD family protein [Actinobacteria bacterium]|nr:RDD family protein [Actinomycetota bacterium]
MNFTRVSLGRRLCALMVDWLMCYAIITASVGGLGSMSSLDGFAVLALFFFEVFALVSMSGASAGQRIVGISVIRFNDGGAPRIGQVFIRTLLLCLVVTAVTFDENGRGLHERLSGTVLTKRGKINA